MTDHTHMCPTCHPELAPNGPQRGEGHLGVRFATRDVTVNVFKDGRWIGNCYEVDVDRGVAWRVRSPIHYCDCRALADYCRYIDTGSFSVALELTA